MDTRNAKDLIVFIVYIIIINVTEIKEMPSEIVNGTLRNNYIAAASSFDSSSPIGT